MAWNRTTLISLLAVVTLPLPLFGNQSAAGTSSSPDPHILIARRIYKKASAIYLCDISITPGRSSEDLDEYQYIVQEIWRSDPRDNRDIKIGDIIPAGKFPKKESTQKSNTPDTFIVCVFPPSSGEGRLFAVSVKGNDVPLLGLPLETVATAFKKPLPSNR